MIVPSMNACELLKEIALDTPMVESKAKYLSESLRRKVVKSKDKNYFHIFDYKSKRQNNWLILINYYKALPTLNSIVYYLNEQGINAICLGEDDRFYRFSPHFLIRYNERFLKQENISTLDLLKRFVSVNKAGITEIDEDTQCIICEFTEGVGLGDIETIGYKKCIYHFRTFISNPMVFESQQRSIQLAGDYYDKYAHDLQKFLGIKSL